MLSLVNECNSKEFFSMKTRTQNKKIFIAFFSAVIFQLCALAQTSQGDENLQRVFPPSSGTFYLLSADSKGVIYPPYPCSPYPSDWEIPVYLRADGKYLVADTPEDAAQLINTRFSLSENQEAVMRTTPDSLPPLPASGSQGGTPQVTLPTLNTNGLWLEIFPGVSAYNNNVSNSTILIHNTKAGGEYMLQSSSVPNPDLWDFETSFVAETNIFVLIGNLGQDQYTSGFFRVVDISPVAEPDYFMVQQNSLYNHLDILKNDYMWGDDYFAASTVGQPTHGTNEYEIGDFAYLKPFTVSYVPEEGFYGIDSFGYSITNSFGGACTSVATVFVNKMGNYSPEAKNDITLTLQTNVYTASFNALTNVIDANNDTLSLYAVTTPKIGTVTYDSQGTITYNRNTNYFGNDRFSYIVTDGKGGFLQDEVQVCQEENAQNPGIPIQWLMHYGFSVSEENTKNDPDNDGLSNLAEFLLGMDPLKAKNPLDLELIEEGDSIGGEIQIPLIGIPTKIPTPSVSLLLDGEILLDTYIYQDIDGVWILGWDTRHITNGNYSVQAVLSYSNNYLNYKEFGAIKNVTVLNPMKFDSLCDYYTSTLFLKSTLAINPAYCVSILYDNYGAPLVTNDTVLTNGLLNLWYNIPTDEEVADPVRFERMEANIFVYPLEVAPDGTTNFTGTYYTDSKWFLKENPIPYPKNFSIAWGWNVNNKNGMILTNVVNILGDPTLPDDNPEYKLLPAGNRVYTSTFRLDTKSDAKTLLNSFKESSNFFWFGHCSRHIFYGSSSKSKGAIEPFDIRNVLENSGYSLKEKTKVLNKHPYRLVIMNGCNSYSATWSKEFGIDFSGNTSFQTTVSRYNSIYREPRAFVGWKNDIEVPNYFGNQNYGIALNILWTRWMNGDRLAQCMLDFLSYINDSNYEEISSFEISGCFDLTKQ